MSSLETLQQAALRRDDARAQPVAAPAAWPRPAPGHRPAGGSRLGSGGGAGAGRPAAGAAAPGLRRAPARHSGAIAQGRRRPAQRRPAAAPAPGLGAKVTRPAGGAGPAVDRADRAQPRRSRGHGQDLGPGRVGRSPRTASGAAATGSATRSAAKPAAASSPAASCSSSSRRRSRTRPRPPCRRTSTTLERAAQAHPQRWKGAPRASLGKFDQIAQPPSPAAWPTARPRPCAWSRPEPRSRAAGAGNRGPARQRKPSRSAGTGRIHARRLVPAGRRSRGSCASSAAEMQQALARQARGGAARPRGAAAGRGRRATGAQVQLASQVSSLAALEQGHPGPCRRAASA